MHTPTSLGTVHPTDTREACFLSDPQCGSLLDFDCSISCKQPYVVLIMTTADLCAYAFKRTFQEEVLTLFQSDAPTNKQKQGTGLTLPTCLVLKLLPLQTGVIHGVTVVHKSQNILSA